MKSAEFVFGSRASTINSDGDAVTLINDLSSNMNNIISELSRRMVRYDEDCHTTAPVSCELCRSLSPNNGVKPEYLQTVKADTSTMYVCNSCSLSALSQDTQRAAESVEGTQTLNMSVYTSLKTIADMQTCIIAIITSAGWKMESWGLHGPTFEAGATVKISTRCVLCSHKHPVLRFKMKKYYNLVAGDTYLFVCEHCATHVKHAIDQ